VSERPSARAFLLARLTRSSGSRTVVLAVIRLDISRLWRCVTRLAIFPGDAAAARNPTGRAEPWPRARDRRERSAFASGRRAA
jgi:hypothetical protein